MLEERVTELEMRYTLQQDHLQQLSDVILAQSREIAALRADIEHLKSPQSGHLGPLDPDEKPPHY